MRFVPSSILFEFAGPSCSLGLHLVTIGKDEWDTVGFGRAGGSVREAQGARGETFHVACATIGAHHADFRCLLLPSGMCSSYFCGFRVLPIAGLIELSSSGSHNERVTEATSSDQCARGKSRRLLFLTRA